MNLPANFIQPLTIILERLADAAFPWGITGSVGMLLQGMDLEVHDIDLQTDCAGAYAMQSRLAEFVTHPLYMRESDLIRSRFGALEMGGIKVEIMGDMQMRQPGEDWEPAPDLAALIRWVEYNGLRLPVLDLEHEYQAYLKMGRAEKAAKLRAFLDQRAKES